MISARGKCHDHGPMERRFRGSRSGSQYTCCRTPASWMSCRVSLGETSGPDARSGIAYKGRAGRLREAGRWESREACGSWCILRLRRRAHRRTGPGTPCGSGCTGPLVVMPFEVFVVGRVVRIVAVGAGHLVLRHRVMRELGELHLHLCVAASAEFLLLVAIDFLLRSLVQLVAVKTAHIIHCMDTCIPAAQVRGGRRRMTFHDKSLIWLGRGTR